MTTLSSGRILSIGTGFWSARIIHTAVELDIFNTLEQQPCSISELCDTLNLHSRAAEDFMDALVAMQLLKREEGQYRNGEEASQFLVKGKSNYIGGAILLASRRGYELWQQLPALIKSGKPQSKAKDGGDFFQALYADANKLKQFILGMSGLSREPIASLVQSFDWKPYKTFCDLGTAQGALPVALVKAHTSLTGYGLDLPPVAPIFNEFINNEQVSNKIEFIGGNFLTDELPAVDVMIYGHILHAWNDANRAALLEKAYGYLNQGGALIVYDAMIDNARSTNLHGLLMSLNLRLETEEGSDYTPRECINWLEAAGFQGVAHGQLTPTVSMVYGFKP